MTFEYLVNDYSERAIAGALGVSRSTVRRDLAGVPGGSGGPPSTPVAVRGRDGKVYGMPALVAERRAAAWRLRSDGYSIRRIASELGVSKGAVQNYLELGR